MLLYWCNYSGDTCSLEVSQNATCWHFHGQSQSHVSEVTGCTKAALHSHTVWAGQRVYNHDHNINMDFYRYKYIS